VLGRSSSPDGFGVVGRNLATTGQARGVLGVTYSTGSGAMGVQGHADGATGVTFGVYGQTNSTAATASGVQGVANAGTGATHGVHGTTYSVGDGACGVYGLAAGATGNTWGVYGQTSSTQSPASGVKGVASGASGIVFGVWGETNSASDTSGGVYGVANSPTGSTHGVRAYVASPTGHALHAYCADPNAYGLFVEQGKSHFAGYATFAGGHGDLAENYRGRDVEAADVVVLGPGGVLVKCTKEADTAVAGIVSTAPSMRLQGRLRDGEGVVPLALVGRVSCKVDATKRPIKVGDLLVTSGTPGHAMACLSRRPAAGTVLGKALEDLEKGTGVIQVLVTLR